MSNLKDFELQETMLCLKAREMGIMTDQTPKCHCKLAGEGIKYAWGCAKNQYRHQPLKHKRGKENFRQTGRKCFSREVVTTERIQHSCLSHDPTRTTHLIINNQFGQHCLSSECV
jgi:hypothetical protein